MLERLLFTISPAVENIDSICTEAANYDELFFGDFTRRKLGSVSRSRIRLAEIFLADFRRTKIRRRIQLTAQAWGSMVGELRFPVTHRQMAKFLFSIALCVV